MTPVFSPDAERIAVVVINRAGPRLWIAGTAGSMPVRLTTEENTIEFAPTWSPEGGWISYVRISHQGGRTIAKVRVGTSQPPIDRIEDPDYTVLPEWSPTGEWIACALSGKSGITLLRPDGKNTKFLRGESAPLA